MWDQESVSKSSTFSKDLSRERPGGGHHTLEAPPSGVTEHVLWDGQIGDVATGENISE